MIPVPVGVVPVIVTFEFPVFVIVTFWFAEAPTVTFPKLTLVGLADRVKVAAVPVPEKLTVVGEFGALLTSDKLPVTLPAAVGPNVAVAVTAWPAERVAGVLSPLTLNPAPVTAADVILRSAWPVFEIVRVCDLDAPEMTLPKLILPADTLNAGCAPLPESATIVGEF